jgi:hypothetical protein
MSIKIAKIIQRRLTESKTEERHRGKEPYRCSENYCEISLLKEPEYAGFAGT